MTAWPVPQPEPIKALTPTVAWDLLHCPQKVAFARDPVQKRWRRSSPKALLGSIAHSLQEQVWRGAADDQAVSVNDWVTLNWDKAIAGAHSTLASDWSPANVAEPADWPGYARTKVRVAIRLRREIETRRKRVGITAPIAPDGFMRLESRSIPGGQIPSNALPLIEEWIADSDRGIAGRPDRIERREGRLRVLDLKSGRLDSEVSPAHRYQLLFYAELCRTRLGQLPDVLALVDLNGDETALPFSSGDASQAVQVGLDAFKAWQASETHQANPNADNCRFCPFRVVCEPFVSNWDEGWSQPIVVGTCEGISKHSDHMEVQVHQDQRRGFEADVVRLVGWPTGQPISVGDTVVAEGLQRIAPDTGRLPWHARLRTFSNPA